jgi:GNAT superfamily N-acetyltransferase
MDNAEVIIRPFMESDRNFILATWLRGQRYGNLYFSEIPQDLYFREYAAVIARTMALPGLEIIVACDTVDPRWIWGFAAVKDDTLYWVHVKTDYREKGIAKLLLAGRSIKTAKAFTRIGRSIAAKHGLIFNPF